MIVKLKDSFPNWRELAAFERTLPDFPPVPEFIKRGKNHKYGIATKVIRKTSKIYPCKHI
jgi:hypothetical protein